MHADDVRTVATNKHSVINQASEINSFTQDNNLNLNTSKLEIIRISQVPKPTETLHIGDFSVTTSKSAKCLGVWWSESLLESFQCEIGRRILQLSKHHSNNVVQNGLHWPSVGTRILLRKLAFLGKLLSSSEDTLRTRVLTTLAIDNAYDNISVVQQCRMLEVQCY